MRFTILCTTLKLWSIKIMPLVRALLVMCIRISSAAIGEAVERFVQQEMACFAVEDKFGYFLIFHRM